MKANFEIAPVEHNGLIHNNVRFDVAYDRHRTGPVLTMLMTKVDADGVEQFSIYSSPRSMLVLEAGWKTNNKKKVQAALDACLKQIEAKSGPVWDKLQEFLAGLNTSLTTKGADSGVV